MRFAEFARKLPTVLDTLTNRGVDILVEKEGNIYLFEIKNTFKETLKQKQDIWADYDPEKTKPGVQQRAGALTGVDLAALKKDMKRQRQQESHGRPT